MTKELMRQALDALCETPSKFGTCSRAIAALRAAIAAPDQEPVATANSMDGHTATKWLKKLPDGTHKLYTAPQAAPPAWIPVIERLPNLLHYVLVTLADPMGTGWIVDHCFIAELNGNGDWVGGDQLADGCVVTHWMPLPKAP